MELSRKELVSLRSKKLSDGTMSLYLDYFVNGKRVREYLRMYIVEVKSKVDRLQNEETMKTALALKAKRTIEVQNNQAGFAKKDSTKLTDYINRVEKRYSERGSSSGANTCRQLGLRIAEFKDVKLSEIDRDYILSLIDFLRGCYNENSLYTMFRMFHTVMNMATRDELIDSNPCNKLPPSEKPKPVDAARVYLTLEEVQRMINCPCESNIVYQMFLFSCFTGLRLGDIENLTWDRIVPSVNSGWQIETTQGKTRKLVSIPLSQNAMQFLPERASGRVWPVDYYRSFIYDNLQRWAKRAGIEKHISFHTSRHTYATMLLTYGADLYTVSKLLGHSNVATTQIYAKVIDEKKVKAVNMIPKIV